MLQQRLADVVVRELAIMLHEQEAEVPVAAVPAPPPGGLREEDTSMASASLSDGCVTASETSEGPAPVEEPSGAPTEGEFVAGIRASSSPRPGELSAVHARGALTGDISVCTCTNRTTSPGAPLDPPRDLPVPHLLDLPSPHRPVPSPVRQLSPNACPYLMSPPLFSSSSAENSPLLPLSRPTPPPVRPESPLAPNRLMSPLLISSSSSSAFSSASQHLQPVSLAGPSFPPPVSKCVII